MRASDVSWFRQEQKFVFKKRVLSFLGTLGVSCVCVSPAHAEQFSLDNGVEGTWSLNVSMGTGMRMGDADPNLISAGNTTSLGLRGQGSTGGDDGNLNFKKYDLFSTVVKAVGELQLRSGDYGAQFRANAWHDLTLSAQAVPHGHVLNSFAADQPLNDRDFDRESRFTGLRLLDAYGFVSKDLDNGLGLTIKAGQHVVNWGESQFIPGINQYNPIDVNAARRPGAQLKEAILPVPQVSTQVVLGNGVTLEGFVQGSWRKSLLDGCGTYWSSADIVNCGASHSLLSLVSVSGQRISDSMANNGIALLGNANFQVQGNSEIAASDRGQFGLASRYFSKALSTEFGTYFVNYHTRFPVLSLYRTPSGNGSVWNGGQAPLRLPGVQWAMDYSAEDIKVFGLSASTQLQGWSVGGELSHHRGIPAQINIPDVVAGLTQGAGPVATRVNAVPIGGYFAGYDRKNKTQFQFYGVRVLPGLLQAESLTLMGEAAFQRWSDIGDAATDIRYGRGFTFSTANWSGSGQAINCSVSGNALINKDYCQVTGYATPFAWGVKVLAELSYPDAVAGINLRPRLFLQKDVKGYSVDGLFMEDRGSVTLGMRGEYSQKYYADIAYTRFVRSARYDVLHDRDFISVVGGMNF